MIDFFLSTQNEEVATDPPTDIYRFVFIGESNSGGVARNSSAQSSELDENDFIQIWDNINNDGHENLDIGSNNLLGHIGFSESFQQQWHGWELGLQSWNNIASKIYLTKAGAGGSRINNWDRTGTYWQNFLTRNSGAVAALAGITITETIVMISFGINDAIAGTNINTWYTDTLAWINDIITEVSPDRIFITELMENGNNKDLFNQKIYDLVANVPSLFLIGSKNYGLVDQNHWNYSAMKQMVNDVKALVIA